MALAAYLWSVGHEPVKIEWLNRKVDGVVQKRCRWTFVASEALDVDVQVYTRGDGMVDAKDYFWKVTEFKKIAYQHHPDTRRQHKPGD